MDIHNEELPALQASHSELLNGQEWVVEAYCHHSQLQCRLPSLYGFLL